MHCLMMKAMCWHLYCWAGYMPNKCTTIQEAIRCYEEAMGCDMEAVIIYPYFVRALILYEEFDKSQKPD